MCYQIPLDWSAGLRVKASPNFYWSVLKYYVCDLITSYDVLCV